MAEQSLKSKTAKGLFWGGLSNIAQQLLGLLFGIFLARILSIDDYGLIGMLTIFISISNTISESGFTAALTNRKEFRHEDYNAVFWFNIWVGIALYALLFFLSPFIADFFRRSELIDLSRILFLSIVFGAFGTAHNAVLFKRMMVREKAKMDLSALVLSGIIGVVLALSGYGYWALALQSLSYSAVGTFLRWCFVPWRPTFHFDFRPVKEMFTFGVNLLLTNVFMQINGNLFSVLLGKFYNAVEVGYYTQGNKWMSMGYMSIGGMINSVAQPLFTQINQERERQVQVLRKMIRFTAFISCPLMLGLGFIGEELIVIAVGDKWLPSVPILQLFCIWGMFLPIQFLYSQLAIAHEKSGFYLRSNVLVGIMQLVVACLMLRWGVLWMVFMHVVVNICVWFALWQWYVWKLIGLRPFDALRDIAPYLGSTLLIFAGVYFVTLPIENLWLSLVTKVALSAALYVGLMYGLKSVILRDCVDFLFRKKRL